MVTSWCTSGGRYYYTFEIVGGTAGAHSVGDKPLELKYKKGDKIWNKKDKRVDIIDAISTSGCGYVYVVALGGFLGVYKLSDIEPYTGQDKVKEQLGSRAKNWLNLTKINHIFEDYEKAMDKIPTTPKPHPYTVILKSGVKVGVTPTMVDYINEQDGLTTSTQTFEDGKFILSEIAAIVPTENIVK